MPRGIPNAKPVEVDPAADEVSASVETGPADDAHAEVVAASERRESFEATRPDGTVVVVDRNIDTGEQTVTEK